jgi:hypothetical protein
MSREYIAQHVLEFRLRDVAALLRGCCVLHFLRVDHLLRDVERELTKFFTIVQRLGQATTIDKSIQACVLNARCSKPFRAAVQALESRLEHYQKNHCSHSIEHVIASLRHMHPP